MDTRASGSKSRVTRREGETSAAAAEIIPGGGRMRVEL